MSKEHKIEKNTNLLKTLLACGKKCTNWIFIQGLSQAQTTENHPEKLDFKAPTPQARWVQGLRTGGAVLVGSAAPAPSSTAPPPRGPYGTGSSRAPRPTGGPRET